MTACSRIHRNRRTLLSLLLLGLGTSSSSALEPTPIDNISLKLSLSRRTDAAAQKDVEDAKAYFAKTQAAQQPDAVRPANAELQSSISNPAISDDAQVDTPTEPDKAEDAAGTADADASRSAVEMPKYPASSAEQKQPRQANDDATVQPSLGTSTPLYSTESIPGCETVIYEPMDPCAPMVISQRPRTLIQYASEQTDAPSEQTDAPSEQTDAPKDQWSAEAIAEKVKDLSGGALVIDSSEPEPDARTVTSGYASTATSALGTPSLPILREILPAVPATALQLQTLGPPVYTSSSVITSYYTDSQGVYSTLKPITRLASYAQEDAALIAPSLDAASSSSASDVSQAAFQGIGLPPPGNDASASIAPSLPSLGSNNVLPGTVAPAPTYPSTTIPSPNPGIPMNTAPAPINSGSSNPVPYDSLPQYRTAPITTGEPFVTEGPCQFDAAYMVSPAYQTVQASNQCGPYAPAYQLTPGTASVPGYYAPPTIMPNQAPGLYSSNNAGHRPLLGFGQENYNVQIGRGIIGQPVAYVPGQTFRNFLRYIFP